MRNPAPLWAGLLHDPGRLAALQYTHVQPRRGAAACKLLEAPQPPPLALVITHETPDRFTACRGSFMSICLYALTAPQSRPGRAQVMRGYNLYHNRQKAHRGAQMGAERPSAPRPTATPRAAVCPYPGLESMVNPAAGAGRSAAGQAAGGQGLPSFCPFCYF